MERNNMIRKKIHVAGATFLLTIKFQVKDENGYISANNVKMCK